MAALMWRYCSRNITRSAAIFNAFGKRTLLSEAYSCNEAWQERLSTPLLRQIVADDFCLRLHEKFEAESRVNAIDMDLLVNKLSDVTVVELDFVEQLLHRFRHTQDALHVLDSTHHAVVREYLKMKEPYRLLPMITDKVGYGVFPDVFCANMLMDYFIKMKDHSAASKIACELMLQEMLDHKTSNLLAMYASFTHAKDLLTTEPTVSEEEQPAEEDDEMEYIPVKYVRNPWYDDHFDITSEKFLLGKTLAMASRQHSDPLTTSVELVGWGLYNKFDKGLSLLATVKDSESGTVAQEAVTYFKQCLQEADVKTEDIEKEHGMMTLDDVKLNARVSQEQQTTYLATLEALLSDLSQADKITSVDLQQSLSTFVESQLPDLEHADIEKQKKLFKEWDTKRQEELDMQIKKYLVHEKRKIIDQKLQELQEKEELLNYFDQKDEIEVAQLKAPPVEENVIEETEEEMLERKAKRKR